MKKMKLLSPLAGSQSPALWDPDLSFLDGKKNRSNSFATITIQRSEAESNQNINGAIRRSIAKIEPISTPIEMKIASG